MLLGTRILRHKRQRAHGVADLLGQRQILLIIWLLAVWAASCWTRWLARFLLKVSSFRSLLCNFMVSLCLFVVPKFGGASWKPCSSGGACHMSSGPSSWVFLLLVLVGATQLQGGSLSWGLLSGLLWLDLFFGLDSCFGFRFGGR